MKADEILSKIKILATNDKEIDIVWLYGSRAKNQVHENSDYDLAVAYHNPRNTDALAKRLRPEVLAIEWQQSLGLADGMLSVVDINQADPLLAMEIIQPNCTLVCKDSTRLAREENRITSMYEEKFPPKN